VSKTHKEAARQTPLMQQYLKLKAKYKDAILLFRVGDFYETFGEDAVRTSNATGIVLTKRNNGSSDIELAGFPYHALDVYMPKLVRAGLRVAICEQLEKPSKDKKIVRRGVTEMVTPGLTTDDKLLDQTANNYLAAIHTGGHQRFGVSFVDISTGEFLTGEGDAAYVSKLFQNYQPAETLLPKSQKDLFQQHLGNNFYTYPLEEWVFTQDYAWEKLTSQFSVTTLKGFGVADLPLGQIAAGALLHYLQETENHKLSHLQTLSRIYAEDHAWLDQFTVRNLEVVNTHSPQGKSLLQVLDDTITPMGARLLRNWVQMPLLQPDRIRLRHDIVRYLLQDADIADHISGHLRQVGDLERLLARAVVGKIAPRELNQLATALENVGKLKALLNNAHLDGLKEVSDRLDKCNALVKAIRQTIQPEPPALLSKGNVIREGADSDLDELRGLIHNAKDILLQIQVEEARRTGISSLKIGFNNVFGYYLEVTNKYKNSDQIPSTWVRKQSTSNAERYVTEELKKLEERILGAEEKISARELALYETLVNSIQQFVTPIQLNARALARLDILAGFARLAARRQYTCPKITEGLDIQIRDGRHPVIEAQLPPGEPYIPNDIFLDPSRQQIIMITGPNMSGKSAILRQTALICLMAQCGSFVPASDAQLGIVDKIFTRVGASDNISSGESTFMVEMNETASIMNNISDRSLILLDEIGRGTATYDGISIAWSIAEYLHENGRCRPKTLFATHYHELNDLASQFDRIRNYHVATQESGSRVLFLRKLLPGGSEHSFGIHVAKMAGMPPEILKRATEVLTWLEEKHAKNPDNAPVSKPPEAVQLSFFDTLDPNLQHIKKTILELELNQMTPIECMIKLQELKKRLLED
jgi:DNA mismatch repair protein MutS